MEEKLKSILLLSPYYYPEPFPINSFIDSLKKKTSKITIITSMPNYRNYGYYKNYSLFGPYSEINDNVQTIRLPVIPRFNNKFSGIFLFYLSFFLLAFIFLFFFSVIKRNKYNHFLTFCGSPVYVGYLGIIFSKIINCKNSLWLQDIWPEAIQSTIGIKYKILNKVINFMQDFMWKKTDLVFCQSESLTKFFLRKYKNIVSYTLLNPSRETNNLHKGYVDQKISNKNYKIFSYLGNIGKAQSIELFLDNFKKIDKKKYKINMCGDGSSLEYFKKKYNYSNIEWHGWIEKEKLKTVINETDFFILSLNSIGRQSLIVPSKLQTYYQYNKPILCFASGASAELINETNTGLLCNNSTDEIILNNIEKMINLDQENYNKMSKNCYNYYLKMLSPDKIADDFIKFI